MANVIHPPFEWNSLGPASRQTSPFGFGFGLSTPLAPMNGRSPGVAPGHTNSGSFQQLASNIAQPNVNKSQKRRLESDEDAVTSRQNRRDESMDRSPTPERLRRAAPKKARVAPPDANLKGEKAGKENKEPNEEENDVDVGVLLASLPPQSLLPLLMSLLERQPSLRSSILPLIPRPTLETALRALENSAKRLRDSYPYSATAQHSSFIQPASFGISHGFGVNRSNAFGSAPTVSPSFSTASNVNGGMRESYIISRLAPHISEFVSACISYLPYFSYIPPPTSNLSTRPGTNNSQMQSPSLRLQPLHKDNLHPSETFEFLSALMTHVLSQPPLTQSSLAPHLLSRLIEEWKAWVNRVDQFVNREGGMFREEIVRQWERGLDDFAEAKNPEVGSSMKEVRDLWVSKVGWLVGRIVHHPMEEEL